MKTVEQAYQERALLRNEMKGATESTRSALSAISGRNVLKFKDETAKIKRDQEIAAAQTAASIAKNNASGAVTMAKAKTNAEAQLNRTKRNEVLSMLNLGIYHPSFSGILGINDSVIKEAARRKDEEYQRALAKKNANKKAKEDYEAAIAAIQNKKAEAEKQAVWYENKVQEAVSTFEAENVLVTDANAAKEQILKDSGVGNKVHDSQWMFKKQNLSAAEAAEVFKNNLSHNSEPLIKSTIENDMKKAEQLRKAAAYYDELLTREIKKKEATGVKLSALEENFKTTYANHPSVRIASARYALENATAENQESLYQAYIEQLEGGIHEAVAASSATALELGDKISRAEKLTNEDQQEIDSQIDAVEKMLDTVHRELRAEDFNIEAQDYLISCVENMETILSGLKSMQEYAVTYEENKEQLVYQYMDGLYGGMPIEELEAVYETQKKALNSKTASTIDGMKQARELLVYGDFKKRMDQLGEYIAQRKTNLKLEQEDAEAEVFYSGFEGESRIDKMLNAISSVRGEMDDYEQYDLFCSLYLDGLSDTPEDVEGDSIIIYKNDNGEVNGYGYITSKGEVWQLAVVGSKEYDANMAKVNYDEAKERLRLLTSSFHRNIETEAENILDAASVAEAATAFAEKYDKAVFENLGGVRRKYAKGLEGYNEGDYSDFYEDIDRFVQGNYGRWTKDEAQRVLALMETQGTDVGFLYYAAAREKVLLKAAEETSSFLRTVEGLVSGPANFVLNGGRMLKNAFEQDYARIAGNCLTASHQVNLQKLDEMGIGGDGLEMLYMTGYSILDMLPTVALATVPYVGKFAAGGYLFSKVTAETYNADITKGKRSDEAFTHSILSATAEVAMEKILGGIPQIASKAGLGAKLGTALENLAATPAMKKVLKIAGSMGAEGFEEFLQEVVSPFLSKMAADLNGIEDAELEKIDWDEAAKSFAIGAITGGFFDGVDLIGKGENIRSATSYEMLTGGEALVTIDAGARLGNKRAREIRKAIQKKAPRYADQQGLFAYASVADINNIQKSIQRHSNRQNLKKISMRIDEQLKGTSPDYRKQAKKMFQKILYGKTLTLHESAQIINDPELRLILEDLLGQEIFHLLPTEVAALARLGAFIDESGKISKERLNLFRDAFGELDYKSLAQIVQYSDLAGYKLSGILYENTATEGNLTETEREATEAMKLLSSETGILYYVTDSHETGTYLASNIMAANRKDLNQGVFYQIGHRAYYMMKEQNQEQGAAVQEFLLNEADRIFGVAGVAAEIKKIRQQMAVDGVEISENVAKDELCARMMPSILLQGSYSAVDRLAAANIDAATSLRKTLGAIRMHMAEEIEYGRIDSELKEFVSDVQKMKNKDSKSKRKYRIGKLSSNNAETIAKAIKKKTGEDVDLTGYEVWIDGSALQHIEDRHGKNGIHDQTMSRLEDYALIPWVADRASFGSVLTNSDGTLDLDYSYRNSNSTGSIQVKLEMPFGDRFFYVIECVPETAKKIVHIKDAYKGNKSSRNGQALDMESFNSPQHTPEALNGYQSATNISIPNSSENVNGDFYQMLFDGISKDTTNIYDRLTARIKEHRAEKFGYRNGDNVSPIGTEFDAFAVVDGNLFTYSDELTEKGNFSYEDRLIMEEDLNQSVAERMESYVESVDEQMLEQASQVAVMEFDSYEPEIQEQYFIERQADIDGLLKLITDQAQRIEPESAEEVAAGMVSTETKKETKTVREKIAGSWNWFRRQIVDSGATVYDIAKNQKNMNLYHYYDAARASSKAAVNMIEKSQTDICGRPVGKGLNGIFKPIMNRGRHYYEQFQFYLYHMHNIDRMSRYSTQAVEQANLEFQLVKEMNPDLAQFSDQEIRQISRDSEHPLRFEALEYAQALDYKEYISNIKDKPVFDYRMTAEKSRMESERLLQEYPEFKELAEEVYQYTRNLMQYRVDSGLIAKELAAKLQEIYPHYVPTARYSGDDGISIQKVLDKVQIGKTIGRAVGGDENLIPLHKQLADQTLSVVREGSKNRFGTKLMELAFGDSKAKQILKVEKAADRMSGVLSFDGKIDEADPFAQEEYENIFAVYKDGELYLMEVTQDLFEAVKALSPNKWETNVIIKYGRKTVDLYKKLITGHNPAFAVRNFCKDMGDALIYSKDLRGFIREYSKAWAEIVGNGEYWKQYEALGGTYSSIFDYETGTVDEQNRGIKKLLNRIEWINRAVEQAPRLAEFMATVKKGDGSMENLMEAMYNAADITTNFGRSGTFGKILNQSFVPFFNPGVQGFSKISRTLTETKGFRPWIKLITKAAVFGFGVPALLNGLLYHDDEEWKLIKQRDKDIYYLFKIEDGLWLKIPKGRVLSVIGMSADRIYKEIKGEEVGWGEFFSTVGDQIMPANPLTDNVLASAVNALAFNKNWYGGDIVGDSMKKLPVAEQYDSSTDRFSVWLGGLIHVAPKKINYLLDSYTGVLGDVILPSLNVASEKGYFSKNFIIDTTYSNRLSEDFYDTLETLEKAHNSMNATDVDDVKYRWWNKKSDDLSEINKKIKQVQAAESLSSKEKEEELKVLYASRNALILTAEEEYEQYTTTVDELTKGDVPEGEEAADYYYREVNRAVYGAEYAIKTYSSATHARAVKVKNEMGISFDDFYDVYFDKSADTDSALEMLADGFDKGSALTISKGFEALKPEKGADSVSYLQKYKAIAGSDVTDIEKLRAMDLFATDTDRRRVTVGTEYDISLDQFISIKESVEIANEAADKKTASNARIKAAIDSTNGLTNRQKAVLWQVFSSSDSAKNNPYSSEVGWETLAKVDLFKKSND